MNRDIRMQMSDFTAGYEGQFWWLRLPFLPGACWTQQVRVNKQGGIMSFV